MKKFLVFALGCLSFFSVAGYGQDLATIVGSVTDSSGAVVAGAKIVAANPQHGISRTSKSSQDGGYTLARIPIGTYVITVEQEGFQKLTVTGITLEVGQTLRVNLELKVGSVSEQVTVSSTAARVETETGSVSHVVTSEQVDQLNLEARNFATLATLIPGAAADGGGFDPSSTGVLANATISFNGVPGNFNNWEIDGTNNVDQGSGSNSLMSSPSVDSIAEFRVSTSNYSAEYGKSGGANIEVVTKSGTSNFHGNMFEFVRNEVFDANDWFLNQAGEPRQPLKRNNFGFTLGGPIFIPKHYNKDRNKTFFFISEEWRSYREGTVINATVPSTRERQGDFSECDPNSANYNNAVAADGLCVVPTDPQTGAAYPNDIVPVNATAAALLDALIPLPTVGATGYRKAPSLSTSVREDMVKIDQNFNDKWRLFVRYTQTKDDQQFIPTLWSSASYATVLSLWSSPAKSLVVHLTETIRPNLLNEVVVNYSQDVNRVNNVTGFDSPANSIYKPDGFSMKTIFPANQDEAKLPGIQFNAGVPFFTSESTGFEFDFIDPQTAIKDNLIWSVGRHNLKTGFFLLSNHINTTTNIGLSTQGFLQFGGGAISTGNGLADMFTGVVASYEEYGRVVDGKLVGGPGQGKWRQWDFEPYVQDDFRVNSRLTLNIGVRYFALTPFYDSSTPTNDSVFVPGNYDAGKQAQYDANGYLITGSGATPLSYGNGLEECGVGSVPKGCATSYRGTFSPRFGFAWDPRGKGKTVVRGGYALNWDSGNPLFAGAGFNGNPPSTADLFGFNIDGYENIGPGPLGPVSFSNVPTGTRMWPQIQQYSLGIQQDLGRGAILGLSYVGTVGHHLQQTLDINQVPVGSTTQNVPAFAGLTNQPGCDSSGNCDVQTALINLVPKIFFAPYRGYTNISMRSPVGNSNYNSLQSDLRLRTSHGLTFEAAYTWSHTLDDIVTNGVDDSDLKRWYGTSSLNQTQVLTANWVYEMPFFAKSQFAAARYLLSSWQLGGIARFSTGPPIDFTCNLNGYASGIGGPVVCDQPGMLTVKKGKLIDPNLGVPTPSWFDPNAVQQVTMDQLAANHQPGMFGTMRKNPLPGPGRNNWDISLIRNFKFLHDKSSMQFRAETFNTFNHPQWAGINTGCGKEDPDGETCAGNGFGQVTSAHQARVIQLGLKWIF